MSNPPEPEAVQQGFAARLLCRRWLAPGIFELHLAKPARFDFRPGQRLRLMRQGVARDYSLVSAPQDQTLVLCLRLVEGGALSPLLAAADPGQELSCQGPRGNFLFRPSKRPAVLVATGTGIAPFIAMIRAGLRDFVLLHGARRRSELLYASQVAPAAAQYVACLSAGGSAPRGPAKPFRGRVTAYLARALPAGGYDFYLSGRRDMVVEATHIIDERFVGSFIFNEIFY